MNEDHAESTLDIVKMEVFGEENMGAICRVTVVVVMMMCGGGGGGGSSSRSRSGGGNKNKSTQDES